MLNVKVNNSIEDRNVQNIFLKRELCQSLVILDGPQNHFRRHTFQHRYYHLGKLHYFIRGRNLFGLSYLSNNSKFKKMQLLPFPRYNCLLRYSPFGVFSCFNRYITIVTSPTNLERLCQGQQAHRQRVLSPAIRCIPFHFTIDIHIPFLLLRLQTFAIGSFLLHLHF